MTLGTGALICFTGIDGSGKTTLASALAFKLVRDGYPACFRSRNHLGKLGYGIRRRFDLLEEMLWEYPSPQVLRSAGDSHLLCLYASWIHLFDHCVVRQDIAAGRIVFTDSWYYKYLARFRLKKESPADKLGRLFSGLTRPLAVVLLETDPAVALERKEALRVTEEGALQGTEENGGSFVRYQAAVSRELGELKTRRWFPVLNNGCQEGGLASAEGVLRQLLPRENC